MSSEAEARERVEPLRLTRRRKAFDDALDDSRTAIERRLLAQQPCYWTWTENQLQPGSLPIGGDCVEACEPIEPPCPRCMAKYDTKPLLAKDEHGFSKIARQPQETSG